MQTKLMKSNSHFILSLNKSDIVGYKNSINNDNSYKNSSNDNSNDSYGVNEIRVPV